MSVEYLVRPLAGTHGGDRVIVGIFSIGKLKFLRSKELGHHKSRNLEEIETIHQRRDAWQQSVPSGKVPTGSC
jgi:hypothetical protein